MKRMAAISFGAGTLLGCGAPTTAVSNEHARSASSTAPRRTTSPAGEEDACEKTWQRLGELPPAPTAGEEAQQCRERPRLDADRTLLLRRLTTAVADAVDERDWETLGCLSHPTLGLDLEAAHIAPPSLRTLEDAVVPYCGATCTTCESFHFPEAPAYFDEWGHLGSRRAHVDDGCYGGVPETMAQLPHIRLEPPRNDPTQRANLDAYVLVFAPDAATQRWYLRAVFVDWHKPRCPG